MIYCFLLHLQYFLSKFVHILVYKWLYANPWAKIFFLWFFSKCIDKHTKHFPRLLSIFLRLFYSFQFSKEPYVDLAERIQHFALLGWRFLQELLSYLFHLLLNHLLIIGFLDLLTGFLNISDLHLLLICKTLQLLVSFQGLIHGSTLTWISSIFIKLVFQIELSHFFLQNWLWDGSTKSGRLLNRLRVPRIESSSLSWC